MCKLFDLVQNTLISGKCYEMITDAFLSPQKLTAEYKVSLYFTHKHLVLFK